MGVRKKRRYHKRDKAFWNKYEEEKQKVSDLSVLTNYEVGLQDTNEIK